MKITQHIGDRNSLEGVNIDVDIEADHVGGSSTDALEVVERVETAVKEEIGSLSDGSNGGRSA